MKRRTFLCSTALAVPGLNAAQAPDLGTSKMKIASVRLVKTRPKHPLPGYKPAANAWSTQGVEVAKPGFGREIEVA